MAFWRKRYLFHRVMRGKMIMRKWEGRLILSTKVDTTASRDSQKQVRILLPARVNETRWPQNDDEGEASRSRDIKSQPCPPCRFERG